jgi:PAS domain S-box-containing protein
MTARDVTKEELIGQLEALEKRILEIEGLEADRVCQINRLKESSRMLHSLLQYSPDPMVVYDAEGRVLLLNSAFTATFGWTNEELWGRRIDYVPEEFLAQTKDTLERSFRGESVPSFDTKRLTKDGRVLDIHISSALFRDDEGKPAGHIVTLRDITEKKQTEGKLRESEKLYQTLFDSVAEGVILQDSQHVIRSFNFAAETILGLTADQVIGKFFFDIVRGCIREDGSAYSLEEYPCTITLQTGRPFSHVVMGIPKKEHTVWISINTRPLIRDGEITPYGVVTSFSDFTERKEAERALKEREEQYRSVFENAGVGIDLLDLEGRIVQVNQALLDMLGYAKEDIYQRTFLDITPPEDKEISRRTLEALHAGEIDSYRIEKRYLRKDGSILWGDLSASAVRNANGERVGTVGVIADITDRKTFEQALTEKEARYRALFENTRNGVAIYEAVDNGEDFILVDFNKAAETITGVQRDRVIGKRVSEVFPDVRRLGLFEVLQKTWESGVPSHHPVSKYQDNRIEIWVENFVYQLPSGEIVALLSDETERMRMEDALKASEEWYRRLVEESFDGIFVQKGSQIVFANSRLYEMLGYSDGELEGTDHWKVYHPDYQEITRERALARMRGEEVVSQYEVKLQRKDGTYFDGEIRAKAVTVKGEPGVRVWVRDVSKRKQSEEVQRRLATAVEQAVETIVITDTEGRIQYVNPAFERVTGYTRDEVIGRNPSLLKSGKHDQTFYKNLWDTIKRGEVWTGRLVNRKKDGSLYHEEAAISPVRDVGGKIINYVSVKRDITEHLQLASQLLHAQKMEAVGTLAGGIAHDFNNLLQVTMGYSELLIQDSNEDDPRRADLLKIFQAAKSGTELVQRLLLFSRKVEPKPVPLNLNRLIMHVEKLLKRTIPKMIDIEIDLFPSLSEINADPSQIEQVLMNLAVNARDAMPDGGKLTFATRNVRLDEEYCRAHVGGAHPGQYVLLTISDTGYGIDKVTIEHIFEPFYTTKELGRGTGLGLAMVYGIVKQHEGYITCESEIGQGTTFGVYLPVIEPRLEPEVEASGEFPALGTETILLVDDEDTVRQLGERILTKSGYTVLIAANGKEAIDVYVQHKEELALVILDLIMPKMGGKDCLKELLRIYPNVKVLISSGFSSAASTRECIELGAKGFVAKPFRFKELLREVRKALDEG